MRPNAAGALLIAAYGLLCLGSLLVHLHLHPPWASLFYWWYAFLDGFSLLLISPLFARRPTAAWACLLNAVCVVFAAAASGQQLINAFPISFSPASPFRHPAVAFLLLYLPRLPLARAILRAMRPQGAAQSQRGCSQ